ncbi:MAG: YIP1 family protein [Thermoanaerobaculum sp.]|nr:YIP1 family protein [Thermoanaerobaculum sp.]MDW7967628.1 YIP1 family protein [Thermoanaerobaculum sp.]
MVPHLLEEKTGELSLRSLHRVARCFYEPKAVFSGVAKAPTFFWVLLLSALLTLGVQVVLVPRIDLEATISQQLSRSGQEISEEQLQEAVKGAQRFQKLALFLAPLGTLAVTALLAGLYFLALKAVGSDAEYPPVLSAVAHAGFPPSVTQSLLLAVVASTRGQLPAQEIPRLVKSNLAAFLPEGAPKMLFGLGQVLDLFNLWYWVLLAWGLSAVGGVSGRKAAGILAVLWGLWAILQMGLALLR